VAGTQAQYEASELEPQLRNAVITSFTTAFAKSNVSFLDMAANQAALATLIAAELAPQFAAYGLELSTFTVENLSLPDELQKRLDERISMNMVGDLRQYAQYQAAQSIPIAAANEGGLAGMGVGLGAGVGIGGMMADAFRGAAAPVQPPASGTPADGAAAAPAAVTGESKFCILCGKSIPAVSKFCNICGGAQS